MICFYFTCSHFTEGILLNIMKEWGSKYNSETKAWEALKGICGRSDIHLQGLLEETEKEVMPQPEIKEEPGIANEEDSERDPLMSETLHSIDENTNVRREKVPEEQAVIQGSQSSEGTQAAHGTIPNTSTDSRFPSKGPQLTANKQNKDGQTVSNLEGPSKSFKETMQQKLTQLSVRFSKDRAKTSSDETGELSKAGPRNSLQDKTGKAKESDG